MTLLGAAMRFAWLDRPTLWNDEAMTYWRVCGSQAQLLNLLQYDGSGPLHYELTWLIGRCVTLTPFWMRFVPALCGTLMIPATYWLGRELFDRRVARLAAILACCSAFLLVYSRDAKMYMQTWSAITLFAACLFAFVRSARWWIGLLGVLAGAAAMLFHATGFVVVPLTILVLLIDRRVRPVTGTWILAGLAIMAAGPAWYFATFNNVLPQVTGERLGLRGIEWVNDRVHGHSSPAVLADLAGAFGFSFAWMDETSVVSIRPAWAMVADAALLTLTAGTTLIAIAWPRGTPEPSRPRVAIAPLLLAIWIVLPVYGIFRLSGFEDLSVVDAFHVLATTPGLTALAAGVVVAGVMPIAHRWRVARIGLLAIASILTAASVALPIFRAILLDPDYPTAAPHWLADASFPIAVPIVALAMIAAATWMRAGDSLRARAMRVWPAIAIGALLIAAMFAIDLLAPGHRPGAMWMPRYLGFVYPAILVAAAALIARLPNATLRWATLAVLIGANLTQAGARVICDTDPPLDRVAADVLAMVNSDGRVATYTYPSSSVTGPTATGSIVNACGRYYLFTESKHEVSPRIFQRIPSDLPLRYTWLPKQIAAYAEAEPQTQRIIVWDRLPAAGSIQSIVDARTLSPPWQKVADERYAVRSFWYWGKLYTYRRCEYVKRP